MVTCEERSGEGLEGERHGWEEFGGLQRRESGLERESDGEVC